MRQKKHDDKRRGINYIKNNQAASSAAYKRTKRSNKDYKKNSHDNQTTNNNNDHRVTDMSMGIGEVKKSKTKNVDKKEENHSPSKDVVTTTQSLSPLYIPLRPLRSEVFDSSNDNAVSEMEEAADMGTNDISKVSSHVEEKRQLDPSTISINDADKKAVPENSLNIIPTNANSTLQEGDRSAIESKEVDEVLKHDARPDIPQVSIESEKQEQLGESVGFYDEVNKEYYQSNSLSNDKDNNDPFISGVKLWQAYNEVWINAYNEYMKACRSMFKQFC